jgi:hypothetical protein
MDDIEATIKSLEEREMNKEEFIYFAKLGNDYVDKIPKHARISRGMLIRLNGDDILISEHRGKFLKEMIKAGKTNKTDLLKAVLMSMAELGVMIAQYEFNVNNVDSTQMFNTGVFIKELLPYTGTK